MAWDPNQGQRQGQPGNGGQEPYSGYGAPPPQNPYGTPPPQDPYGAPPPQYGYPPNQQSGYGYGYSPPGQPPRSLGQAIQELPNQYIKILTKPSVQSFFEEMGKADWAIVWIQLIAIAIAGTIFGLIRGAIGLASNPFVTTGGFNLSVYQALIVSGSTFSFVSVPLSFFIVVGVQYLIAKAFQGQGNFLTQSYTTLLYQTPIYIASYVLGLIPILGGILGAALYIYGIVLNVYSIMAVHRLSGGRATAVVLIPIAVVFLLVFLCIIILAALFVVSSRTTTP